mmetsp:Transcript_6611/g.13276  ORF Transcript_6611/g.13276 Transcript_6611/m.13276 type:complete len:522 (-) Transcript_6611:110-1675(-)
MRKRMSTPKLKLFIPVLISSHAMQRGNVTIVRIMRNAIIKSKATFLSLFGWMRYFPSPIATPPSFFWCACTMFLASMDILRCSPSSPLFFWSVRTSTNSSRSIFPSPSLSISAINVSTTFMAATSSPDSCASLNLSSKCKSVSASKTSSFLRKPSPFLSSIWNASLALAFAINRDPIENRRLEDRRAIRSPSTSSSPSPLSLESLFSGVRGFCGGGRPFTPKPPSAIFSVKIFFSATVSLPRLIFFIPPLLALSSSFLNEIPPAGRDIESGLRSPSPNSSTPGIFTIGDVSDLLLLPSGGVMEPSCSNFISSSSAMTDPAMERALSIGDIIGCEYFFFLAATRGGSDDGCTFALSEREGGADTGCTTGEFFGSVFEAEGFAPLFFFGLFFSIRRRLSSSVRPWLPTLPKGLTRRGGGESSLDPALVLADLQESRRSERLASLFPSAFDSLWVYSFFASLLDRLETINSTIARLSRESRASEALIFEAAKQSVSVSTILQRSESKITREGRGGLWLELADSA